MALLERALFGAGLRTAARYAARFASVRAGRDAAELAAGRAAAAEGFACVSGRKPRRRGAAVDRAADEDAGLGPGKRDTEWSGRLKRPPLTGERSH